MVAESGPYRAAAALTILIPGSTGDSDVYCHRNPTRTIMDLPVSSGARRGVERCDTSPAVQGTSQM